MNSLPTHRRSSFGISLAIFVAMWCVAPVVEAGPVASDATTSATDLAIRAEADRIKLIARLTPTVVCIFDAGQTGGGSGVLIDDRGMGLTNYHVVASMLATRRGWGGLSDGNLYELEVLGIDPGGDVAMFRLIGKDRFDFAELGDSDSVATGDRVLAVGNPFTLAERYTPSVSLGIVTGVHRYQEGVSAGLLYTDCIQTDAAVNPGNSGGPLFDLTGKIIGINGRISPNWERGVPGAGYRFNVGLGYAISINQIRRFIPGLRAGLLVRHGTPQATVAAAPDGRVVFDQVMEDAPAWDAGIRPGDELIAFGGRSIGSPNDYANALGVYPENWPVSIVFGHGNQLHSAPLRLEPLSVPMKRPYEVDPEVNARAVTRTLQAYSHALGSAAVGSMSWQARRTGVNADGQPFDAMVSWRIDGRVGVEELLAPGSHPRTTWFTAGGIIDDTSSTQIRVRAMSNALYAVRHRIASGMWSGPMDEAELAWSHVGADELVVPNSAGRVASSPLLEILEAPFGRDIVIQLAFDIDTHLLRRVIFREKPTGLDVTLTLENYRVIAGRPIAHTVHLDGALGRYVEQRSHVEVLP